MNIPLVLFSIIAAFAMASVGCQKNEPAPAKNVDMPAPKLESSSCKDSQRQLLALGTPPQSQLMFTLVQLAKNLSASEVQALAQCLDQSLSIDCSFEKNCSLFEKEKL